MGLRVQDRRAAVRRVQELGLDTRRPGLPRRLRQEALQLDQRGLLVLGGTGEVRPQRLEAQPARRPHARRTPSSPRADTRPPGACPVSTFTCTPIVAAGAAAADSRSSAASEYRLGVSPARERRGLGPGRELRQHQDRALDPRIAQPEPLLDERDAEPRRRPPRARRRATATSPCPYASAFTTAISSAPSGFSIAHVVADRVEVHLDPRGTQPRSRVLPHPVHGLRHVARDVGCERPLARRPARQRCRPARGRRRRRTPRRRGSTPRATNPPMIPVSTSPDPAVARTGPPVGLIRTTPSGVVTSVRLPFSSVTAPVRSASARACAKRSSASSRADTPERRTNSPTCGVRTASRLAIGEVGRAPGERVEPVRVDHERHRTVADELAEPAPRSRRWWRARDRSPARPRPPDARAAAPSAESATVPSRVSGSGRNVVSTSRACTIGRIPSGTATWTSPAPIRPAASRDQMGGPRHVARARDHDTSTPVARLWVSISRSGRTAATSAGSIRNASARIRSGGNPMSATRTAPASSAPGQHRHARPSARRTSR